MAACTHTALSRLDVINGSGSGWYEPGEEVVIKAVIPPVQRLVSWEGDTIHLKKISQEMAVVRIPENAVLITAYLLPTPELSFRHQVFPLIQKHCNFDGCHTNSTKQVNFTGYEAVTSVYSKIEQYFDIGFMPLNRVMPEAEKQLILDWIAQGRKNN